MLQRGVPTELLVIQSTPFCNLDCKYCYLPQRDLRHRMDDRCLSDIGRALFSSPPPPVELTVIWHAGEPMVLPAEWYRNAFALLESHRKDDRRVVHAFQTNGTLIDADWIALLRQPDIRLGVSVDGPAHLHDRNRVRRDGRGSFERTMDGIRSLQSAGIPFHTISVLTAATLDQPDAFAEFFIENDLRQICLNIEEIDGINRQSTLQANGSVERFASFLHRFLDRLERAPGRFWVREIQSALDAIRARPSGSAGLMNPQTTPLAILSIDANGTVSTYSPELLGIESERYGSFAFGTVGDLQDLTDIFDNPQFQQVRTAVEDGVRRCAESCEYFAWCGGGAPANKLGETGRLDVAETQFCRLVVQTTLEVVIERLTAPAERRA